MNSKKKIAETLLTVGLLFTAGCGGTPQVSAITVLSDIEEPGVEQTIQFSAKVEPEGASSKVTWSVSDESYMSINADSGVAKTLNKEGTVTVTATATDGSGKKGTKSVTITKKAITSITVTSKPDRAGVGGSVQFSATVLPEGATKTVTWSVSDDTYLTIDAKTGVAKALKEGTVDVTATATDGSGKKGTKTFVITGESPVVDVSLFEMPKNQETYSINTASTNMDKVGDIANITRTSSDGYMSSHFYYNDDTKMTVDTYKVGSANPFKYQGVVVGYDSEFVEHKEDAIQEFELWLKNGEEFAKVSDTDLPTYLDLTKLDVRNSSFQFKDAAVGKTFKLITRPSKSTYKYSADLKNQIIIDVIEGYNVYNFADLTTFDNWNTAKLKEYCNQYKFTLPGDYMGGVWDEFKKNNNIPDQQFNKVILHGNIKVKTEDLPKYLVWNENELNNYIKNNKDKWDTFVSLKKQIHQKEIEEGKIKDIEEFCKELMRGSLKDRVGIFIRYVKENETFTFEGNYFTIDTSEVKPVVCFEDKTLDKYQESDGSHSELFAVTGDRGYYEKKSSAGDAVYDYYRPYSPHQNFGVVEIKNLQMKGNAPRSGTTDEGAGGLIAVKHCGKDLKLTNVICSEFFTATMAAMKDVDPSIPGVETSMHIDRCRVTDAYSSMFYFWGNTKNYISNSFCKNAGGAILICDEVFEVNEDTQTVTNKFTPVTETSNCYFEAFVTGQEPWFVSKGASFLVSILSGISAVEGGLYNSYKDKDYPKTDCQHRSFGKLDQQTPKINMVALTLCAAHPFNAYTNGNLTLKLKSDNQDVVDLAMANDPNSVISKYRVAAGASPLISFMSSKGGHAMVADVAGTNGIMYDAELAAKGIGENGMIDFANYFANRSTIDAATTVCNSNIGNFFSGDYCACYLQATAGLNLVGALLGYK